MKKSNLSLFWKFSIITVFVVIVFGIINIFLLSNSVYRSFEKEIDKRSLVLSSIVAEKVVTPIIYEDVVSIYSILDETMRIDPTIAYIFLLDKAGNVIAQAPEMNISNSLRQANDLLGGMYQVKVIEAENFEHKTIRDISYPILKGEIGIVRLGIVEESITNELKSATSNLLMMIGFFLLVGLLGALFFSYIITSPLRLISEKATSVNLDSIEKEDFKVPPPKYKKILNIFFEDELDQLVSKFNMMLVRLRNNVAEQKKTRDSFLQAEKLAAIGTLTSGIGHEINNPLSGIKNGVNRIIKKPENTEQNAVYLELIQEAVGKIEHVVQGLLNFSRKQDVEFKKINPVEVLEVSINLAAYKLKKHNIVIEHSLCCVQFINASVNHLSQVFLNLILNAIDAIEEKRQTNPGLDGRIKIDITCENNKSIIRIMDNGIGIKEAISSQVFDPFFTSKEVGKGTGLGLYVSFDIIKEHGGNLSFTSTYGVGTVFIIELPIIETRELENGDSFKNILEF